MKYVILNNYLIKMFASVNLLFISFCCSIKKKKMVNASEVVHRVESLGKITFVCFSAWQTAKPVGTERCSQKKFINTLLKVLSSKACHVISSMVQVWTLWTMVWVNCRHTCTCVLRDTKKTLENRKKWAKKKYDLPQIWFFFLVSIRDTL